MDRDGSTVAHPTEIEDEPAYKEYCFLKAAKRFGALTTG
jgi:hypothetical protein